MCAFWHHARMTANASHAVGQSARVAGTLSDCMRLLAVIGTE